MKSFFTILFVLFFSSVSSVSLAQTQEEFVFPEGYAKNSEVKGDLNQDGLEDLVIVIQHKLESVFGPGAALCPPRGLVIYLRGKDQKLFLAGVSYSVVYGAHDGGMLGDPLQDVKIKNSVIEVHHYGGSSDRWGVVQKFRYQNSGFYLIGETRFSGRVGELSQEIDKNLNTQTVVESSVDDEGNKKVIKQYKDPKAVPVYFTEAKL